MKRESSSDVPVLVIIPWRRKLEHWIGLKVTYFKTDFTRRIPFSLEQKKRRSSTLVHLIKILHESVQNGKVSLFFFSEICLCFRSCQKAFWEWVLTFRQYNDLDFFSKISVFIILHLYLTVFCFIWMLSHFGTLKEMTNENKSNSPSLAASIATFCKLHPKKLSV